jgi:hypothetical protein
MDRRDRGCWPRNVANRRSNKSGGRDNRLIGTTIMDRRDRGCCSRNFANRRSNNRRIGTTVANRWSNKRGGRNNGLFRKGRGLDGLD